MKNALITPTRNNSTQDAPGRPSTRGPISVWTWLGLVCLLLGISGGTRYWRERHFQSLSKESENAPFPLSSFPRTLGEWQAAEGLESTLDPEVARIAGSADHLIRTYVNETSGERAEVLVLYGSAFLVWAHTPDACYPAAGFRQVSPPQDIDIQVPSSTTTARFRMQNFVKLKAGQSFHQEVYHSFLNAGRWDVEMYKNWKSFRYHPGMFKIQVQCQGSATANADNTSVRELLGRIVSEVESRSTAKP